MDALINVAKCVKVDIRVFAQKLVYKFAFLPSKTVNSLLIMILLCLQRRNSKPTLNPCVLYQIGKRGGGGKQNQPNRKDEESVREATAA